MIPKVEINGLSFKDSVFDSDGTMWRAEDLYEHAKKEGCDPFDLPLAGLYLDGMPFTINNMVDFAEHCKRVNEANLSHPIIIDTLGCIADGNHRIIKALINGESTIKAIRLNTMPEPFLKNED